MVNAMAPNAPMRREPHDTTPTIQNNTLEKDSMKPSITAPRAPKLLNRKSKQDRDQQHLQDLAFRKCVGEL